MNSEQTRLEDLLRQVSAGNDINKKLVYDKDAKVLRPSSPFYDDPDRTIRVSNEDMRLSG